MTDAEEYIVPAPTRGAKVTETEAFTGPDGTVLLRITAIDGGIGTSRVFAIDMPDLYGMLLKLEQAVGEKFAEGSALTEEENRG